MKLGEKIQKLRKEKGYSQEEFAKHIGIGRSTLANYEQCKREPNYSMVELIANALNTTPSYLMGWDDNGLLNYVVEDDKEIVKHFLKFNPYDPTKHMSIEELSIKKILNSFGYDLSYNGENYYLVSDYGAAIITKNELSELISTTSKFLEFNVNKIILDKTRECKNNKKRDQR